MDFIPIMTEQGNQIAVQTLFETGDIEFTRIEIGSGRNAYPEKSTALNNAVISGQFLGCERKDNTAILKFTFDNRQVTESFNWTEYGVWAKFKNQSDETKEVLYAYGCTNETGDKIPAFVGGSSYLKNNLNMVVAIGNANNVSAYLGEYEDYLSKEDFQTHLNDKSNPHIVTKEQIGLGSVENVSVSNAIPLFDKEILNTITSDSKKYNLQQGEKVSILWAKTERAISDLFLHLQNYKNPHNVTLEQLTGVSSLNALLKKIITDGNQHIELRNGRYIKGQSTDGKSHTLIGLGTDNNVFVGNNESLYTHLHAKSNICMKVEDSSQNGAYWRINESGVLFPYLIPKGSSTTQQNNNSSLGISSRRVGTVYATRALNTSDAKLKENINDAEIGLEILKRLSIVQFNFIGEKDVKCGVIAQEVFKLFQELGIHNSGVYQASVIHDEFVETIDKDGQTIRIPKIIPELENLSDDEILKHSDSEITWNVDYNTLTYYCLAGFQKYMQETSSRLSEIEKEVFKNE